MATFSLYNAVEWLDISTVHGFGLSIIILFILKHLKVITQNFHERKLKFTVI